MMQAVQQTVLGSVKTPTSSCATSESCAGCDTAVHDVTAALTSQHQISDIKF